MAFKEYREIKVCKQSGYHYKPTPTIILKGQWLQELGFTYGDKVQVRCEKGKLIITKAEEAVVAFPETSITSAMKVAEAENRYGRRCR